MTRAAVCIWLALAMPLPAGAWNAHGHRVITYLALDGLPPDAPEWLRDEQVSHRIAHQSGEPDRWRGWPAAALGHVNKPDHYLDIELLDQFGLTLETVPPLRNEYLRAMAVSKHLHPEKVEPYDAGSDPDRSREWPGFLPHAICEHYARLQACFMQVRILERIGDPNRAFQAVQARENAIYHMGMLSHFVGDAAQPLHTTKHFNGWVGDNPGGYTTDRGFHAYIDGGVLEHHGVTYGSVRPHVTYGVRVNRPDPWRDVIALLRRSFDGVEPLYRLERDGELRREAGRQLITERLADASATLAALYAAAWAGSVPNEKQVADFLRFDTFAPARLPAGPPSAAQLPTTQPATQPAATQPTQTRPGTPQPVTSPAADADAPRTRLELRISPLVDLHYLMRKAASGGVTPPLHSAEPALEAVRYVSGELGGGLMWGLLEPWLAECETLAEARARCERLPESVQSRSGKTLPLRALALRLCEAYEPLEGQFLRELWHDRHARIDASRERLTAVLGPREEACWSFVLSSLGMSDPGHGIPVYLVAEAPWPGGFTHRAPGGRGVCFVGLDAGETPLLVETVIHEAIHALEVASAGQQTVFRDLRRGLRGAGFDDRSPYMRDVPHTLIFVQAGETVRRVLDPAHRHYGDVEGYYARIGPAATAVRAPWIDYLDGKCDRASALKRIVEGLRTPDPESAAAP